MPSITPSQRQTGWLEQSLRNCPPKSRDLQVVARNVLITKWMEEDSSVIAPPIQEYHLHVTNEQLERFYIGGIGKHNVLHPERILGQRDPQWLILKIYIDKNVIPRAFMAPRGLSAFWGSVDIKEALCAAVQAESDIITDGPKYSTIYEFARV